jgi:3-isopropylmalate/(R)-2-methylmalate dehydratase small subunit
MKTLVDSSNVLVLGDNIDTDLIIPARHLLTTDPAELGAHCFEDLLDDLPSLMRGNGVIVASNNFGSGSSREHAPLALIGAGVQCVIAQSFARIFFRNSFNVGFPLLTCAGIASAVGKGDRLLVDLEAGAVENVSRKSKLAAQPIAPFMIELLRAGGLIPHVAAKLRARGGAR